MTEPQSSLIQEEFGTLPSGDEVVAARLDNKVGGRVRIRKYGASLHSVSAPDRDGRLAGPVLGHASLAEYPSTQSGLQFYSGNFLDATPAGRSGRHYRMGEAIALEPRIFSDTPNQPDFGSLRLDPGQTYHHTILSRLSTEAAPAASL